MENETRSTAPRVGGSTKNLASALMLFATALVVAALVFLSLAWLAVSKQVDANSMMVTVDGRRFELGVTATLDADMPYEDILETRGYDTTATETSGSVIGVACPLVASDGNALQPGSYGTMSFYVKPARAEDRYQISFDLLISGIQRLVNGEDVTYEPLGDASEVRQFLKGHVLFFQTYDATTHKYSDWVDWDEGFQYDMTGKTPDASGRFIITLHWVWPRTYAQIALADGDVNMPGGTESLFAASSADRTAIRARIEAQPQEFFQSVDAPISGKSLLQLSDGYNRADQAIGDTVAYLVTELKVGP